MQRPTSYDYANANTGLPYYRDDAASASASANDARHTDTAGGYGYTSSYAPRAGYGAPANAGYYVAPQPDYYAPADDMTTTMAGDVLAAQDISVLNPQRFGWQAAGLQAPHASHGGNTTAVALGNVPEGDEESVARTKTPSAFEVEDAVPAAKRSHRKRNILIGLGVALLAGGGAAAGGILGTRKHSGGSSAAASTLSAQLGDTTTPAGSTTTVPSIVSPASSSPSSTGRSSTTTTPVSTPRRSTTPMSTSTTSPFTSPRGSSTTTTSSSSTTSRSTSSSSVSTSTSDSTSSTSQSSSTTRPPSSTGPTPYPSTTFVPSDAGSTVDNFGFTGTRRA